MAIRDAAIHLGYASRSGDPERSLAAVEKIEALISLLAEARRAIDPKRHRAIERKIRRTLKTI